MLLTLFLSFLLGLEREEHKVTVDHYSFGGVRTFPLIGLIGYAMAFISGDQLLPLTLGFAVVGGFLMVAYQHKLTTAQYAGVTTEMSGLATYLVGVLVYREQYWIATAITVLSLFLLELKGVLEGLTQKIAPEEVLTFTKFLLLSAVILPILPNLDFGPFKINPFRTWVVVVAVSAISYGSYVIQKVTKTQAGLLLTSILGGAYSSTVTTVVLAKRAATVKRPHVVSGATLMASGVMYLRISALLALFNRDLMAALVPSFALLAAGALGIDGLVVQASRHEHAQDQNGIRTPESSGIARGTDVCRSFCNDADCHTCGRSIPGKGRHLLAGSCDGVCRRGSIHPRHHP